MRKVIVLDLMALFFDLLETSLEKQNIDKFYKVKVFVYSIHY